MNNYIPYGKQTIDDDDIESIINVLQDNKFLTTGPKIQEFEDKISNFTNMKYSVVVSNGTAALHSAIHAIDIKKNDEIIVTTLSFIASANCILYCNAVPIFCDINKETMNIDENKIENLITNKTRAIICVDFAGQLCNYDKIYTIAKKYNLIIIQDAAHSFGVTENKYADLITSSFHPVKNITTGEGGVILTNNERYASKLKQFRNHGIDNDYNNRYLHYYDMTNLGYNYRLTDIQCALGISQLNKIDKWIKKRQNIANIYKNEINNSELKNFIKPLKIINKCAYHIFVIKLKNLNKYNYNRDEIYKKIIENNIGVNVHYKPIHLHTYYIKNLNTYVGQCPVAEKIYKKILTLPLYPTLTNDNINYIIKILKNIFECN